MNASSPPSMDQWLREAKAHESAPKIGMYLIHNGTVRRSARAQVRDRQADTRPVTGMLFSYDAERVQAAIDDTLRLEGIHYVRVWLNEGTLRTSEDIMFVLVGGDIRPRVIAALDQLVGRIKRECVHETELYDAP